MNEEQTSYICRALGDPNRLKIVGMLTKGEMCGCRLLAAFEITQPTLSHHMKILGDCGLVNARKEGKWTYYSLNCSTLTVFRNKIASLTCCGKGQETKS